MGPESAGTGQCCQKLAEKLEKSESGRKKLRQAISLLKEKLDATEKVLHINETLRQDLEKERKRADAESKDACEQRRLREERNRNGSYCQDEMLRVIQRLDALEECQKADRKAVDLLLTEVKLSLKGIGSSLQSIESAQSAVQALEKDILSKVTGSTLASEKASNVAKSGHQTALSALTACNAAQSTAKTAQSTAMSVKAEVQKLAASVTLVQKQSSKLEEQVAALVRTAANCGTKKVGSTFVDAESGRGASGLVLDAKCKSKSVTGMVLSETQLQNTVPAQDQRQTGADTSLVVDGGMPAIKGAASMVGTSQSTASSGQPSAQTACKLDEPPSATEAQLLSVRVDSLQTQHKMLEQQVSTLLQGRKPDGSGKCTTSADIVGDRMSSGFIRPRNRSKDGTPFLSSSLRVQQPGHSFGHLVCRKDGEGRFPGCPCVGHAESPTCPHGRQVKCKEVSVEQLSQMCSVTAEPVTPVDETSPAVKESTSGALSFDLVESMRHLVLKGNRNQSKMLSMLQALQESMAGSGQEKIGSISPAERIQESGSTRVKRKRNGRQSCDDAKDSQDQVEVKKRSKEKRRRRREQDSRYGKHHIAPASVPNTTAQMPNVDESASVREVGELNSSIEAGPQYRCVGVEGCEAMSASRCNEFVKSEGKAQYQLRTEEGVVDLALERGGTAVVVLATISAQLVKCPSLLSKVQVRIITIC